MRAMRENVAVTAQISQLTDTTHKVLAENEELKKQKRELQSEMEILEPMLNEVSHRNISNLKVSAKI